WLTCNLSRSMWYLRAGGLRSTRSLWSGPQRSREAPTVTNFTDVGLHVIPVGPARFIDTVSKPYEERP
ncbi:hypothetical protein J6590_021387, partial [Homalodisca vitripennis]